MSNINFFKLIEEISKEVENGNINATNKLKNIIEEGRKTIVLNVNDVNSTIKGKKGDVTVIDILKQLDIDNHKFRFKDLKKIIDNFGLPVKIGTELEKAGWIKQIGRGKFELTNKAVEKIIKDDFNLNDKKLKKVTKSVTKRMDVQLKKYKIPPSPKSSLTDKIIEMILSNMISQISGSSKIGILLAGNPGTGKTSTIRFLAKLFGMNLVTIEAPHITEENVISIPYIIIDNKANKDIVDTMTLKNEGSEYKLVYAESNLVTKLKQLPLIKEQDHAKIIKSNPLLKQYYEQYAPIISEVRRKSKSDKIGFSTILFLDEYYRRPSERIGNILRGILDGRIGSEKMPFDVYPIFATNLKDDSGDVEEQLEHEEFIQIDVNKVSKEEFGRFVLNKYSPIDLTTGEEKEDLSEVDYVIDSDVYNEFLDILPEDLDEENLEGLRISPRRTEQILVFLNSSLKHIKTEKDVRATLQYFKHMYTDYTTGEINPQYEKLKKLLVKLVKERKPEINVNDDIQELQPTEWLNTFDLILKAKEDAGDNLTITPIFASEPGQGKTSMIKQYVKENKQGMIYINGYELDTDDVVGIPIPNENGEKIETTFTEPPLYKKIMAEYNELKKNQPEIFSNQRRYNVVLFIDEFSRVKNQKVFNAIRMMMLEHKINAKFALPDDILVVSSMNPNGTGTSELSEHMKDVVNVIPVGLSFKKLMDYLENNTDKTYEEDFKIAPVLRNTLSNICMEFSTTEDLDGNKINPDLAKYYWEVLDGIIVYVSPRILTSAYFETLNMTKIRLLKNGINIDNLTFDNEEDIKNVANILLELWKDSILTTLQNQIKDKNEMEDSDWVKVKRKINEIIIESSDSLIENISKVSSDVAESFSLEKILEVENKTKIDKIFDKEIIAESYKKYVNGSESIQPIVVDLNNALNKAYNDKLFSFDSKENILIYFRFINKVLAILKENVSSGDFELIKMDVIKIFKELSNIFEIDVTSKKNLETIIMYGEIYETKEFEEFKTLIGKNGNEED